MRVSLIQITSTEDVESNLRTCHRLAAQAADAGARWLLFPENAPFLGADRSRHEAAEPLDGPMIHAFQEMATQHSAWVTVGGFPEAFESDPTRTYNTQVLIDPAGEVSNVYRKIHLFDAQVDKNTVYRESDHVVPGTTPTLAKIQIDGEWVHVGMTICYDLRFPELYRDLRDEGAEIFTVPSAFTLQTGRDHWHPLLQARAIENQVYVLAPNQYGHHGGSRWSYGHTVAYDPYGLQVALASEQEGFITVDLDLEYLRGVRERMPVQAHRRIGRTRDC